NMRSLLNFNSDSRYSANQMRIRIAIATATPTALTKWHKVALISNWKSTWCPMNNPDLNSSGCLDGFYDANSQVTNICIRLKMCKFLQIAKDQYQLTDDDALELLAFFKNNITEACQHLDGNLLNGNPSLRLEIDKPWRLLSKSIRELPGIEILSVHTYFATLGEVFLVEPKLMLNVLPAVPIVKRFAGRYVRIQRTYHDGSVVRAGCALANSYAEFEIACVLLPSDVDNNLGQVWAQMLHHLQLYMPPLVLASCAWSRCE
ncbi:hypothetical protein KR093_007641, partial [Drosophila rubida]